ncbi:hypothetical protein D3C87_1414340 [compost metagenome]
MLNDPNLVTKVENAAAKATPPPAMGTMANEDEGMMVATARKPNGKPVKKEYGKNVSAVTSATGNNTMLAQVVGVIIGSPEFQRK